jgi:hypothetical protein
MTALWIHLDRRSASWLQGRRRKAADDERGAEMQTRKRHLRRWIALAVAAAAVASPAAQAAGPDDRAAYRGTSPALAPTSQSPDDRALYRATSSALAPASLGPDDRPFMRNVREIDPRTVPVAVVSPPHGFDWSDAAIGGAFGLALALLGAGAILIAHRRRSTLSPA